MVKKLLILFIFFSFITKPIGGVDSTNPILSRLTFSDVFGALAIVFGLKYFFISLIEKNKINRFYKTSLTMVVCMFLVIPFSLNMQATTIEAMIILFLIIVSVLIFATFKNELTQTLFPVIINTAIVAAALGFYDIIASTVGLPRIFDARSDGEVISGFRNGGQAGSYFMIIITILLPLKYSKMKEYLSLKYQKRLNVALILSIIFLITTGKVAAYAGTAIGMILLFLQQRNFKSIFLMIIVSTFLYVGFLNLNSISPILYKRLNSKIQTRVVQNYDGTSKSTFLKDNYSAALKAFEDNPLTGSGIGGFYGNYSHHEVHSTPLKMIGEGGLIITVVYILFMISFMSFFRVTNNNNPYQNYLQIMLPFIIGCIISWGYTYHLRKREFWILIATVVIVKYSVRKWKNKSNKMTIYER